MRYRDLKQERDDAIARAVEAERLSMKSEFDRVTREFEEERAKFLEHAVEAARAEYRRGFNDGLEALARDVATCVSIRKEHEAFKTEINELLQRTNTP
jgi:hypothetical protein